MILIRVHEAESIVTHRVEVFPASIGRSMHCSVRIDDLSVSSRHAELHSSDDGFVIRDLSSTNGLYRDDRKVDAVILGAEEVLYLGDVRVDISTQDRSDKTAAKRALPVQARYGTGTPLRIGLALVTAYSAVCLIAASEQYEISWPPDRLSDLFSKAFMLWVPVVLVALLISLFCKLNVKRFYFYQVLLLIASAAMATQACIALSPTLTYNLHQLPLSGFVAHFGNGFIAYWLVFTLQRYVFQRLTVRQRSLIATAAAGLAIGATQIDVDRHRSGERPMMTPLGLDLRPELDLKPNADDLFFDLALSVTAVDRQRIKILESLETERDAN